MPRGGFFDSDDSPSSPSLEKLILAELRGEFPSSTSTSSSGSSSSRSSWRIAPRSPTSTLDFVPGGPEMRFRSWSIPGQRPRQKSSDSEAPSTPQPKLPVSKRLSGCVAECAGSCTALCCCPFTLFHILFLKVPVLITGKISETCRKAKRRLSQATYSTATESPGLSPCGSIKHHPATSSVASESSPPGKPEAPSPPLKIPASIQKQMGFGADHWREIDSPHSSVSGS